MNMNLSELRKLPHLSSSSIGDYIDCGLLYKFGRIDRIPRTFSSDNLEYGSCIHRVLDNYYQSKMINSPLSQEEVLSLFEKYWTQAIGGKLEVKFAKGKDFETYLNDGRSLLTTYLNELPEDNFKILAIEEPFAFTIEGMDIPIIGQMDLVLEDDSGTIIIVDWKTAGKAYSRDDVDKNFQLTLYQMAARANGFSDREILLRFDCLIKTKTPKFEQYYTTRTDEDILRAKKKILKVAEGISKSVFVPNDSGNWRCKFCNYSEHCNNWFLDKEVA
jgi:putative RecB family exonuclease